MKKTGLIHLLFLLGLLAPGVSSAGKLEMIEDAIESEKLEIKVGNDLSGIVRGKICDRCEIIIVKVAPTTRLFIKGKEEPLSKATSRSGKPGTAFFNIKTQQVTKIYSY